MWKNKKVSYFSFIELMVVLVIAATITAIVAPRMAGVISTVRINSAARQIRTVLEFTKSTAITKRKICRVLYTTEKKRFTVYINSKHKVTDDMEYFNKLKDPLAQYGIPSGVEIMKIQADDGEITGNDFSFDIFPMGSQAQIIITIGDKTDYRLDIVIELGSGIVKITQVNDIKDL
jgi:hypothetical protein